MKILIVEDEPSLREIMVRTLTREQYVVEQAADYAAALDKIAAYDYDCILLDIMLPGGSGLRLLEELKRRRSPAAVIIIRPAIPSTTRSRGWNSAPTTTFPSRSTWRN